MSETELSVVCKNCGSEVSPYVTECPYCGARLRKRAPKLERRGDGFEATEPRTRRRPRLGRSRIAALDSTRPYTTIAVILASAASLLALQLGNGVLDSYGGIFVGGQVFPDIADPWRYLTAPFVYSSIGYWFVISAAIAIIGPGLERRLGSIPTVVLLVASGSLGMLIAVGIEDSRDTVGAIAGGNGMALGALAAWLAIRHAEVRGAIDEEYDVIGAAVIATVLIALPLFDSSANIFAGLAGGAVGGLAGLAAAALRPSD